MAHFLHGMASRVRFSIEDITAYCTGDTLSNSALQDELRLLEDIEEESDEEHMVDGDSEDDEQESRAENLLVGAYNHTQSLNTVVTAAECDSLLYLDPDWFEQ